MHWKRNHKYISHWNRWEHIEEHLWEQFNLWSICETNKRWEENANICFVNQLHRQTNKRIETNYKYKQKQWHLGTLLAWVALIWLSWISCIGGLWVAWATLVVLCCVSWFYRSNPFFKTNQFQLMFALPYMWRISCDRLTFVFFVHLNVMRIFQN